MSCEIINPRKDLPEVAEQMYRALKLKACGCGKRVVDGKAVYVQCGGCVATERYEAIMQAIR